MKNTLSTPIVKGKLIIFDEDGQAEIIELTHGQLEITVDTKIPTARGCIDTTTQNKSEIKLHCGIEESQPFEYIQKIFEKRYRKAGEPGIMGRASAMVNVAPEKLVVLHKESLKDAYSRTWWKETGFDLLKAFLSGQQVRYGGFSEVAYTSDTWFQCSRELMQERLALIERWANGECSITLDHCLIEGESIAFDVKGMDYEEHKWISKVPTTRKDWEDILPTIEKFVKYGGSKERLFSSPYCTPQFMATKLPFIRAFIDCKEVVCAEETDYWIDEDGYEHFSFCEHPDLYTLLE